LGVAVELVRARAVVGTKSIVVTAMAGGHTTINYKIQRKKHGNGHSKGNG
jgi:hypothetical protein